ncbi:carcinoembryonic antigen-related cell adhesion molecule 5-like [Cololabis saira]|uniref:carcinoembryonic antigen-related cell adhesion molecule 5-like n=1 Tax=Cololabis saira TaxID=129043 RepID=UPI002AD222F4|nr:carcinoembryonic antigen-related cell adhesion molecule 5-like [Cololabis saira]XP_061573153.1 carcinoembryonic antigen-related cell adhesion molecule 5-like [Cololabis saira]
MIYLIILGAISGLSEGAGVLPDGPLNSPVGGTVMFTTTLTPSDGPFTAVFWRFGVRDIISYDPTSNNTHPDYEGRITFFPSTASLELRDLTLDDSGEYAVNISPGFLSGRTRLDIYMYEPVSSVTVTPSSLDLVEFNSSARLSCSSSGSVTSYVWMNGSSEVTASDRVHVTDGGSTLTVVNVSRYDQGSYRCHVFNPVSDATSDPVIISVSYGPENIKLKLSPLQNQYNTGSDINLTCSAESRPSAQFTWLLDGKQLSDTGPELRLMNIQTTQSGNYSCQAFNSRTMRYKNTQPSVISVVAEEPGSPPAGAIAAIVVVCLVVAAGGPAIGVCVYKGQQSQRDKAKPNSRNTGVIINPIIPSTSAATALEKEPQEQEHVYQNMPGIYDKVQ